jgi:hypothetical protein
MKLASITTALLSLAATATAVFESLDTANATDIAESLVHPRAKCTLHVRWVSNWSEDAYRRYRVKAWANRGGAYATRKEMVVEWSNRAGCTYSNKIMNTMSVPRNQHCCAHACWTPFSGGIRPRPHE